MRNAERPLVAITSYQSIIFIGKSLSFSSFIMNKTVKIFIGIVVIILVIWGIFGLMRKNSEAPVTGESEIIKIGYFGPFTGPAAATSGDDIANGFKLAAVEKNAFGNKKIEVIYEDDACDPKKAVSAATKLISVDKVKILVSGVCSGSTVSAAPIAESNKVILFTPVSTSPKITDAGDYIFRTSASAVVTAEAVSGMLQRLGYKKVALLYENADYPVGWKDAFVKKFTEIAGNTITTVESVAANGSDMRTQLLKLNQSKPNALVLVMNSTITANASIKQIKELAIKLPIIGNEYYAFKEVVTNPEADGIYAAQYKYDQNSLGLKKVLSTYQKTYGKLPSQEIYTALAYDGYNVLFSALKACDGDEPECIKKELYKIKNFGGISGNITIDQNGDTQREFTLRMVRGGRLVDVTQ